MSDFKFVIDAVVGDPVGLVERGIRSGDLSLVKVDRVARVTKKQLVTNGKRRIWRQTGIEIGGSRFRWYLISEDDHREFTERTNVESDLREKVQEEKDRLRSTKGWEYADYLMSFFSHLDTDEIAEKFSEDQLRDAAIAFGFDTGENQFPRRSDDVDWIVSEERFHFGQFVFDVAKAKSIISRNPRDVELIDVSKIASLVKRCAGYESNMILIDWHKVDQEKVDTTFPLIFTDTRDLSCCIIDGWHRIAKGTEQGQMIFPAVRLNSYELELVCPELF